MVEYQIVVRSKAASYGADAATFSPEFSKTETGQSLTVGYMLVRQRDTSPSTTAVRVCLLTVLHIYNIVSACAFSKPRARAT